MSTETQAPRPMFRLEYESKNRGFYSESSNDFWKLAKKLETLRRPADLWILDEHGVKIETVGGCEPAEGQDDKRIKWQWWYDKTAGAA